MLICAGHQPNYLPWLGLFDKLSQCDVFIIEDCVQFEHNGFENRNKVRVTNQAKWLTVPVKHVGKSQLISEVQIGNGAEPSWHERHWLTLKHNYGKAPYWEKFGGFFEETYSRHWEMLIDVNMHLIKGIMGFLGIKKPLVMASTLNVKGRKSDLILAQDKKLEATIHLAGTGAREYMDTESFEKAGIKVVFQDFRYPVYEQVRMPFLPNLSVVDYLFCTGGKPWRNADGSLKERV